MSAEEPMPEQVVAQVDQQLPGITLTGTITDDTPAVVGKVNDVVMVDDASVPVVNDGSAPMADDGSAPMVDDGSIPTENKDSAPVVSTPTRKKGTEIPPEHRGAIYQRYLNGESMGNIAKSEGLSKSTIQHVVRKVKETGSTQTKPRCGRPLKQGELSRTTLRRRKLKGLLVEGGEDITDPSIQIELHPNDPMNTVQSVPYPITAAMPPVSRRVGASSEFCLVQTPATETVVCSDIYGINHAVPTTELQWRPAAYAIVIKNTSILLLKQNGGAYDLPGGGVRLGEDPQHALLRELKEETGINATGPTLLGAESSLFRASHSDNQSYHSILMYYACAYAGGKISTRGLDAHEKQYVEGAEWVRLSALDGIKVSSTVDFRPYVQKATART
jgi:8-oxo-dGTP diphosphatase